MSICKLLENCKWHIYIKRNITNHRVTCTTISCEWMQKRTKWDGGGSFVSLTDYWRIKMFCNEMAGRNQTIKGSNKMRKILFHRRSGDKDNCFRNECDLNLKLFMWWSMSDNKQIDRFFCWTRGAMTEESVCVSSYFLDA